MIGLQTQTNNQFVVNGLLGNKHVQSLLASSKLRKHLKKKTATELLVSEQDQILDCGNSVQLHALYSPQKERKKSNKLVVLIHGWEGSAESTYLLSAADALYRAGFSIVRLHLRDHGPSAHLNEGIFHAARLEELVGALKTIEQTIPASAYFLVGFSLGGNFALRVSQVMHDVGLNFKQVAAVSPVISPKRTMQALEQGAALYRSYFIRKWKKALEKKQACFESTYNFSDLLQKKTLQEMTAYLVHHYTPYKDENHYYQQYTLSQTQLQSAQVKTSLFLAADDPVIPYETMLEHSERSLLSLRVSPKGGHCGFIKNWRCQSWIDEELINLFQ